MQECFGYVSYVGPFNLAWLQLEVASRTYFSMLSLAPNFGAQRLCLSLNGGQSPDAMHTLHIRQAELR